MSFNATAFRDQFPLLKSPAHGGRLHYMDSASTTPMPGPVLEALVEFESNHRANVSRAGYQLAVRATDSYENARNSVARYLGVNSKGVVFTSGTTESINLLAHSLEAGFNAGDEVIVSQAEHHSNFIPWLMLRDRVGINIKTIPLLSDGRLDLERLDQLVSERTRLIAVTHASNVTGAVTDVQRIVSAASQVGAQVLLDGAQAVAHGPIDLTALGVDYYAFSGHKCFAPTGVGVLWARPGLLDSLPAFKGGGGMVGRVSLEGFTKAPGFRGFEAGTPPIGQAVALGAALEWLMTLPWDKIKIHEQQLISTMLASLAGIDGVRVIGPDNGGDRLPIFSFDMEGAHPHDICHILDSKGLALRGGHHCAQPLMDAFDLMATSRASLSFYNDDEDIAALVNGLQEARDVLL